MKAKYTIILLLFIVCTNIKSNAQAVNVQDSLALVDLYNSTNGPGWIKNKFWLRGPVSKWYGISLTDTSVTSIFLGSNNLTGTIPASLGHMKKLFNLALPYNQLTGSIPFSFKNLASINQINLEDNQLTGSIPPGLSELVSLNHLSLSYNQLSGNIPGVLSRLVNLYQLGLDYNQLTGSIPASFGKFTLINYLHLNNNQLTGNIPKSLGNLSNLVALYLGHNQLTGLIPSTINNLSNLTFIDLSNNQLRGNIPAGIENITGLQYLFLSNNRLSGSIPPELANLALFKLDIAANHFTFDGMELLVQTFGSTFLYNDQAAIPVYQNGNVLSVSAGGTLSYNTYKWFKVGQSGFTTITNDSLFHPSKSGKYFVQVSNLLATELVLKSDTLEYTAPDVRISNSASVQGAQQSSKTTGFFVFPNPVKDILYIQTTAKAIITLTDQSGKTILTKTINGNDEISISHLPAGLYYLKNNETDAVQKVMIVK